ncbi:Cyclic di-GMP phosphodiesterase Gmr [Labrenzia sp. THAF82]|nr:Cyclic di-GMP phosphodiesterase Gmr [Labrenzia sp. THAF82]
MKGRFSFPFSRLVMALFAIGLVGTGIALFWVTYMGSLSIAEYEVARSAKSKATLARLVFNQHLDQLEGRIRMVASDPALQNALAEKDEAAAKAIVEQASQSMTSAVLDLLLIDLPDENGWVKSSLGLIDLTDQLPFDVRQAMPPDIWITYSNHHTDPMEVTAALSILVIDPDTGQLLGRVFGGTSVTSSFSLPGVLAKNLQVDDISFAHDDHIVAGIGELMSDTLHHRVTTGSEDVQYLLENDQLFVIAPLIADLDGHMLSAIIKQPIDTLKNVKATYSQLFLPFLVYTLLLALCAALLVNRITSAGLGRLMRYAMNLRQDRLVSAPQAGLISEFNKLSAMFQTAFETVRNRDAQFKDMIDGSLHGVLVHSNRRVLYVNDALLKMLGYEPGTSEQLVGTPLLTFYAPEEHDRLRSYLKMRGSGGAPRVYDVKGQHRDGHTVWFEQHVRLTEWRGENALYVTITDISERKRQEELATKNANFDILTGLPNRRLLLDRLRQSLQRNRHDGVLTALMILDIDRFKMVNETYGPKAGDRVIESVASRLTQTMGPDQTVARMGGDEFAIILSDPEDRWEIERIAKEILTDISDPIELEDGTRVVLSGSLGITLAPNDGDDDEVLLLQADTSMHQAKAESGTSYRFFATRMNEQTARAGLVEASLRRAIESDELHLNYQPIVDFASNKVVGCEALARWTDDKLGVVPPTEFIQVAEECGLIVPLGEWVLREACTFFQSCNRNGMKLESISVNISPRQCREEDFLTRLRDILHDTDMDPAHLCLEITESVMFDDQRTNPVEILTAISSLGIRISLDDFGTGYSSLSYLKRLPIDTLKVDRAFVMDLEQDQDDQALVQAIISMARSLGINVVCEGAETLEQCDLILSFGCQLIQGYHFARPMVGVDFHGYLVNMNGTDQVAAEAG